MDIRAFKEGDRHAVIELWRACELTRSWNDPNKDIDRKLQFQPELFFVDLSGSELIASAMAGYDGHRGSVFYLAVQPQHQGKGYGEKLMAHIELTLQSLGCPKLNIVVRSSNEKVIGFYSRLAYLQDDVVSVGKRLMSDE